MKGCNTPSRKKPTFQGRLHVNTGQDKNDAKGHTPAIPKSLTSVKVKMKAGLSFPSCSYSSRGALLGVEACSDIV